MASGFRFGRRVKLPSTVEIKHELRMMILADSIDALRRQAAARGNSLHRLSVEISVTKAAISSFIGPLRTARAARGVNAKTASR